MESRDKPGVATKIIAGSIAGASETMITYPAEFVKTRKQLPQFSHGTISSLSILKSTYRKSGILGFYSGCPPLAVSNALKSGIRFLTFESSRDYLEKVLIIKQGQRNPWVNVLAGLSAGVAESLLVVTPGEALKTRMIEDAALKGNHRLANKGVVAAMSFVIREEGLGALWRGALPVLSKQATNSAVRFTSFGIMQEQVARQWPAFQSHVGTTLVIGALSGIVTVYASMPFDNIKTRIQSAKSQYKGMLHCAVLTLRDEGIGAFWRGTTPRLVRLTLSSSITFTVYDQVVRAAKLLQRKPFEELRSS
ncbi:hypothetical protein ZTR_00541 [Talaromyces verruculosus]|nr:hypothetical protein ZTR_00541 [Talaromyces verruculosus]